MTSAHTFHIPVLGIGFTADTPLKVSHLGIDSVISLVDDSLLEKLRKHYCEKFKIKYQEISRNCEDFRAKRITSYLNLINELSEKKAQLLKKYRENFKKGSIDVNIMTKLDRENFKNGEKLPHQYNDAYAALRGYAMSDLSSAVVFSAGMNPGLYSYAEQFEDFYPNEKGEIKKRIILKVSDFRSAFIQGKFMAKKGLWVSEYRIESGLNCGGHAFATEGHLLGPILEEFKNNRQMLQKTTFDILADALAAKSRIVPYGEMSIKITAQGGVGTAEEHKFLLENYGVDSVGWGTPFLLVPEVVNIDDNTLDLLTNSTEDDVYLSDISPLGVPFNTLKGNTKDIEKAEYIKEGHPGSPCPKKCVALNFEFSEKGICTASRQYQSLKINQLKGLNISEEERNAQFDKIVEKSCICAGLGTSALLVNNIDTKSVGTGVSVCPGPNIAYFSRKMKLQEMIDHIYGKINVITTKDRPNFLIKELNLYIDYIKNKISKAKAESALDDKSKRYFDTFLENLKGGIDYYNELFNSKSYLFKEKKEQILRELKIGRKEIETLKIS